MSYSFEYIDIILLAMIAGFIFLRLRGILGKKTGFEEDIDSSFAHEAPPTKKNIDLNASTFDENARKEFVKGAKIAYETIITNFANGKLKEIKSLLDKNVYQQFEEAIKDRDAKSFSSETTFIGINSALINTNESCFGNIPFFFSFLYSVIKLIIYFFIY